MSENKPQDDSEARVQGEGDYDAARRCRKGVTDFVDRSDVDELAKQAQPASAKEARENALAEEQARSRSKGDTQADMARMREHESKQADADTEG